MNIEKDLFERKDNTKKVRDSKTGTMEGDLFKSLKRKWISDLRRRFWKPTSVI